MIKNQTVQVRLDEYTNNKLRALENKYNLSKSEIIRKSIAMFENGTINDLFGVDIAEMLLPFDGNFSLLDFGMAGNSWLDGDGFWLKLSSKIPIQISSFKYGSIDVTIDSERNTVYIPKGFLNDIQNILSIIIRASRT